MKKLLFAILLLILSCKKTVESVDCAGVADGTAELDACGVCDHDSSNDCVNCDLISHLSLNMIPQYFYFIQSPNQAFYYFQNIKIDTLNIDHADWVGVFNGDICVGARQWDTSGYCSNDQYPDETTCEAATINAIDELSCEESGGSWDEEGATCFATWTWSQCNNGICDLPAMGYNGDESTEGYMLTGDVPNFKIYDVSEGAIYDANSTEDISPWNNLSSYYVDTSLEALISSATNCR